MEKELSLMDKMVIRDLREDQKLATPELYASLENEIEKIKRGRKPFADGKIRKHRVTTCFNEAEYDAVLNAVGDREIAEFIRSTLLEAIKFKK